MGIYHRLVIFEHFIILASIKDYFHKLDEVAKAACRPTVALCGKKTVRAISVRAVQ